MGSLVLKSRHRVLCGDSTNASDVSRLMNGEKADLCFTSPPYNLGKSVGLRNGARKGASSAYNDFEDSGDEWPNLMRASIDLAISVCEVCAINVQLLSGNKIDLLQIFGEYASKTIDVAVWVKSNPQPAMADGVMTTAFEFVWLISSDDMPTRRVGGASFQRGTFSNVFQHATASGHDASIHGAVFPVGVAGHFIGGLSPVKSLIYDAFLGSSTTIIAAHKLGRRAFGIDIDARYIDVGCQRFINLTGEQPILESTGETFDEVKARRAIPTPEDERTPVDADAELVGADVEVEA